MARPVAGGDFLPASFVSGGPSYPAKRRTVDADDDDLYRQEVRYKRPKNVYNPYADTVAYRMTVEDPPAGGFTSHHHHHHAHLPPPFPQFSLLPQPPRPASAPPMERTASGLSIQSDPTEFGGSTKLLEDHEAAQRVCEHLATFRRRNPDSKHERILRSIINPRHQDYPLDNDSLLSIFSAANEIFFNGRLSQRVMWDWSHESSTQYDCRVIGTTALRRANPKTRGFETLIVLSSTILQDERYSRRLLISTFLHELIHSYMFICCGFRARCDGGHTAGFRDIAQIVDGWAGKDAALYLSRVEANLELFQKDKKNDERYSAVTGRSRVPAAPSVYPCSGMAEEQEYARDSTTDAVVAATGYGSQKEALRPYTAGAGPPYHQQDMVLVGQYQTDHRGNGFSIGSVTGAEHNGPWRRQPQRAHRPGPVYMSYPSDYVAAVASSASSYVSPEAKFFYQRP